MEAEYDFAHAVYRSLTWKTRPPSAPAPASAPWPAWGRAVCPPHRSPWSLIRAWPAALLGHLSGAIAGPSIARGTSFLKDSHRQADFCSGHSASSTTRTAPAAMRSKPFDAEGVANIRSAPWSRMGTLTTWLLDLSSARQLDLAIHRARRARHLRSALAGADKPVSGAGHHVAGRPAGETGTGFYVTSLMGMGVNGVTGDYSRGASGFWIENGEIAFPVTEMTIAGNLKDMFLSLTPADDLEFRYGTNSPTVRIEGLTVAGGA